MRDFIEGLEEILKDYIHGPRRLALTEHEEVKVKKVCDTISSPTETMLARVGEVISLQEINHPVLDGT